jgi:DNA polymerase elongation subunit (family B)
MSELPVYVINTVQSVTEGPDKEDFVFYTYIEGNDSDIKIKIRRNPQVEFYVTKPSHRDPDINTKIQTMPKSSLDQYFCTPKDLNNVLASALGTRNKNPYHLLSNFHVYNADITAEYQLRASISKRTSSIVAQHPEYPEHLPINKVERGALDIETSTTPDRPLGEVILCSFTDFNLKTYVGIDRQYAGPHTLQEFADHMRVAIGEERILKYGLTFELMMGNEVEIIAWCLDKVHKSNVSAVGIWNMDFDIPHLLKRLEYRKVDPKTVFCDSRIPEKYQVLNYVHGIPRATEHFTEKWSWFHCTAKHFFYDAMCLHSRLNKVNGLEPAFGLSFIMDKYLKEPKLFADEESSHPDMQTNRKLDYCAYNAWDSILVVLFERKMKQIEALLTLNGINPLSIFNKSTHTGKNEFTSYCGDSKNLAVCTVKGPNIADYEEDAPALGGAVLEPNKAMGLGVSILEENEVESKVNVSNSDLDITTAYPMATVTLNDSRDTALYTTLSVNGNPNLTEDFFSNFLQAKENAVYLMSTYFNAPTMTGLLDIYRRDYAPQKESAGI